MATNSLGTQDRQGEATARVHIRPAGVDDRDRCARIFFDAFESIATRHNFPIEPQSREFTDFLTGRFLATDGIAALVAVHDDTVVGSAFADERGPIVGIGPVVVDPTVQDTGIGHALMTALLDRAQQRRAAGIRLVQTAYHYRSLALYAKLGFAVREPLSVFAGDPAPGGAPAHDVRPATESDLDACNAVCRRVHGHDRSEEVREALDVGLARVVEVDGHITGYATGFGYGWHAVAESNNDMIDLIKSAEAFAGLGILVPSRNTELMRWCLTSGLRVVQQSTLMTIGLYNEPQGAWLPSISY